MMPADHNKLSALFKSNVSHEDVSGTIVCLSREHADAIKKTTEGKKENGFKNFFKAWPRTYEFLVFLIGPTFFTGLTARRFAKKYPFDGLLLHAGSGTRRLPVPSVNVDLFPFTGVDVAADLSALPFRDATFDGITCDQVLEHVSDPRAVTAEFERVVKPNGLIHVATPFVFPWHPSPSDFTRWTQEGLLSLFPSCELVEKGITGGPCSAATAFLSGFLATILCFGIRPLQGVLQYLFLIILSPLKFLDILFARIPGAELVAANCYIVVRKK